MKKAIMLCFLPLIALSLQGQTMETTELKEYFLDAEFFFAQEEYSDALYDYMELYNNGYSENANINYRIGICYLNLTGQKDKSLSFLNFAVKNTTAKYKAGSFKETRAPLDAWLYLGNAYRINNELNKAIEVYEKFKTLTRSADEISFADQQIAACRIAIQFINEPQEIRKTNLGTPVNSNSSNFKAVISGDGKTLVYMNELPFYDAVYYCRFESGAWTEPINITPQIQSDGNQYVSSLSYDGKTLYLTREDNFDSDILVSLYETDKWTKSAPLGGNINTKYWESHASVSRDGKSIYFASNRRGGPGSMDIYKATLNENGQWNEPFPLESTVNTVLNEDTPFITDNDSILYFSSQGHLTMGGYDILRSTLTPDGKWSEPANLKYPLNTTDDDLFYYPWRNGTIGYVSLFEKDGFGKEDIYAVQQTADEPYYALLKDLVKEELPLVLPELAAISADKPVADTVFPAEAAALPSEPAQPPSAETVTPVPSTEPEPVVQEEVILKEIVLNPVYFNFDNFQLSETGKIELKRLAGILQNLPNSTLKLYGYADAMGSAQYNLSLSEKRAVAAMKFLVSLGIEAKRLSAIGLGETNFAAINSNPDGSDNPEGRKLNRRVEFEVLGIDTDKIIIRRPAVPENLKFRSE
jgi:outer membrane protein OmpA-like peptidoglycan-associated protein